MFARERDKTEPVHWGNGLSYRLLVETDQMGFTVCHTVVEAGTKSRLEYRRHLEACYCIKGSGRVEAADGSAVIDVVPGVLYALDEHDAHFLIASPDEDLELISVFNPPLRGDERHSLDSDGFSQY
ncbi:ectoine synthase [Streptacidiphilus jiangxiensis]|uniref:L-ectoine synthase n=1 Tax=Streptacidiphilus jiangxiensis TaxID=235985 RepID=A0A1H7VMN0_STRJI|nr:ectoine synthase [Streptacidiphilus jiangxiensis]SEM10038.1 L-ectoine synthase [Streptacidiphilus jiangxiensis]